MLRVLGSNSSSIADVFTRAFCLFPLVPSEEIQWWHHKICCLGECISTFSSISVQNEILISLGHMKVFCTILKCWWISKTSQCLHGEQEQALDCLKGYFHPLPRGQGTWPFLQLVLGHGKFAYYSCAKWMGRKAWYITWILNEKCNKNPLLDLGCTLDQKGFLYDSSLSMAVWLQCAAVGKTTASAERFGEG